MVDVAVIKEKWRAVVEAALKNCPNNDSFTKPDIAEMLSDKLVTVTPQEGNMVELAAFYQRPTKETAPESVRVPQMLMAEFQEQGVDETRMLLRKNVWKGGTGEKCYNGDFKVSLPLNEDTVALLERAVQNVGNQNPMLFEVQQEMADMLKKAQKTPGVTKPQFETWLAKLPERLVASVAVIQK